MYIPKMISDIMFKMSYLWEKLDLQNLDYLTFFNQKILFNDPKGEK